MHSQTKHIDIDYHFVHDQVTVKALHVSFISTKDQIADIFTKPLVFNCFLLLRLSLTMLPLLHSREGISHIHHTTAHYATQHHNHHNQTPHKQAAKISEESQQSNINN